MSSSTTSTKSVQCFGKKKNAVAVAHCKEGRGMIKVNGVPIQHVEPKILRYKIYEPILCLGQDRFSALDIRIRCHGGGTVSQLYAIRQSIARSVLAYVQKYGDETTRTELRTALVDTDRSLLVADSRRMEPKKFNGPGARARYQKSYR